MRNIMKRVGMLGLALTVMALAGTITSCNKKDDNTVSTQLNSGGGSSTQSIVTLRGGAE